MLRLSWIAFAFLLLSALPVQAQQGGEDDRDRRLRELEERLGEKSPEEIRELREKLRRLKRKPEQEKKDLRRRNKRAHHIARRLIADLPEGVREKIDALPRERRDALSRHVVGRMAELMREQLFESLTKRKRERLKKLRGPERGRALLMIKETQVLDKLSEEGRAELERLPPPERKERIGRMLRRVHEAGLAKARRSVLDEMKALLELPPKEMDLRLRAPWIVRKLREHGLQDFSRRVLRLDPRELRRRMAELDRILRIKDRSRRAADLEAWKRNLPE